MKNILKDTHYFKNVEVDVLVRRSLDHNRVFLSYTTSNECTWRTWRQFWVEANWYKSIFSSFFVLFLTFKDLKYFLLLYVKIHNNNFPKYFPISLKYYYYLFYFLYFILFIYSLSLISPLSCPFPSGGREAGLEEKTRLGKSSNGLGSKSNPMKCLLGRKQESWNDSKQR